MPHHTRLLEANTKWVLFLSGKDDAEDRHVMDLAFGLKCLESVNIPPENIFIYIDGKDRNSIAGWIASGSSRANITIKESADYFADQTHNAHDHMVMFVTGHGV